MVRIYLLLKSKKSFVLRYLNVWYERVDEALAFALNFYFERYFYVSFTRSE